MGTTTWHPVRLYFSTGPETHSVRLSIWRARGRIFPTEISGTFWVDSVSLKSMGSAASRQLIPPDSAEYVIHLDERRPGVATLLDAEATGKADPLTLPIARILLVATLMARPGRLALWLPGPGLPWAWWLVPRFSCGQ